MKRRLAWPRRGAANNTAYLETSAEFCPPEGIQNVRMIDPTGDRLRFSPRNGMQVVSGQRLGPSSASMVQAIGVVANASQITGYELGASTVIDGGESRDGTNIQNSVNFLKYNGWIIGTDTGLNAELNEAGQNDPTWSNTAGTNAPFGAEGAFTCCWAPDGEAAYIVSIFPLVTTLQAMFSISKFDRDGNLVTSFGSAEGFAGYVVLGDFNPGGGAVTVGVFPNHIVCNGEYLFIAAGKWVYVVRSDNGKYLQRFNLGGWTEEAMSLGVRGDGSLVAAFAGKSGTVQKAVGTAALDTHPTDTTPSARDNGFYWRSGVALCTVLTGVALPGTVLALAQFGTKRTDTGAADYEDHPTFRFAEQSRVLRGFGCIPSCLCVLPDDSIIVGRTNRGWGRTDADRPADTQPRVNLVRISGGGIGAVLEWEADTDSILETTDYDIDDNGSTDYTVRHDIPVMADTTPTAGTRLNTTADPHPTIDALCASVFADEVYAAGRRTANVPNNVYRIRAADGAVLARAPVSKSVDVSTEHWASQNAIAFNELDGTVVVAGERKNAGTPDYSHVFVLDPVTLAVIREQNLLFSVDAYGLSASINGEILYVTGKAVLP